MPKLDMALWWKCLRHFDCTPKQAKKGTELYSKVKSMYDKAHGSSGKGIDLPKLGGAKSVGDEVAMVVDKIFPHKSSKNPKITPTVTPLIHTYDSKPAMGTSHEGVSGSKDLLADKLEDIQDTHSNALIEYLKNYHWAEVHLSPTQYRALKAGKTVRGKPAHSDFDTTHRRYRLPLTGGQMKAYHSAQRSHLKTGRHKSIALDGAGFGDFLDSVGDFLKKGVAVVAKYVAPVLEFAAEFLPPTHPYLIALKVALQVVARGSKLVDGLVNKAAEADAASDEAEADYEEGIADYEEKKAAAAAATGAKKEAAAKKVAAAKAKVEKLKKEAAEKKKKAEKLAKEADSENKKLAGEQKKAKEAADKAKKAAEEAKKKKGKGMDMKGHPDRSDDEYEEGDVDIQKPEMVTLVKPQDDNEMCSLTKLPIKKMRKEPKTKMFEKHPKKTKKEGKVVGGALVGLDQTTKVDELQPDKPERLDIISHRVKNTKVQRLAGKSRRVAM